MMTFRYPSSVLMKATRLGCNRMHTSTRLSLHMSIPVSSEKKIKSIPYRGDYSQQGADDRRRWVEDVTKTSLSNLGGWWEPNAPFDEEHLIANIENAIGVIRIPVGAVGPIHINGMYAKGTFIIPAATLEGALLASACRGTTALTKSGGVEANAFRQRILRAPTFFCETSEQADRLGKWIQDSIEHLHPVVASVSKRAKLKTIDYFIDGERLNLFFAFDSSEAAGQNMTSTCTSACTRWIMDQVATDESTPRVNITRLIEENILSGDKQITSLNAIFGRGVSVIAKASIPENVVQSVFKMPSEELETGFNIYRDFLHRAGSPSVHCGNVPNMVAAMFAATGQDLGSVGECSQAFLNVRKSKGAEGGLDVQLNMPCLSIGTVGGGTALPTQVQCLEMIGCTGPKSNLKLAEIIASVCLGAELSLMSSFLSAEAHASSHDKLGKNRPI